MKTAPVSAAVRQRLAFLLVANALLLLATALLLKPGSSFAEVLLRAGPDLAPVVLAGAGLTGIICTGAIDLSVGSIIAVGATLFGVLAARGQPPAVAFAAVVGACWLLSMLNGAAIRALRMPPIIVTLAGLPLYRGVALLLADGALPHFSGNITVVADAYHAPGKEHAGWILGSAVAAALAWEAFGRQPRRWRALGSSPEACRLQGLDPGRILQSAFNAGGVFLGLAALVLVTRVQAVEPARIALGFELQVIGAVILGGTSIFGGEGSFAGTVLGAVFLYLVGQVLVYAGASPYFQDAITGALILLVIGVDCAVHRRRKLLEELA